MCHQQETKHPMWNEQSIAIGERTLNLAGGNSSGAPLVMFHGVLRRWQGFLPLGALLSTRWQVHAVDHRGHGRSSPMPGAYRVADYVADGVELVRRQFREPVAIYGHSLGAMVAAGVAAEAPECVRAIVLEDPPFDTMGTRFHHTTLHNYFAALQMLQPFSDPTPILAQRLAQVQYMNAKSGELLTLGEQRDATTLRFMASCLRQLDPAVLAPIVEHRWLEGWDWKRALERIPCPLLLLQADVTVGGMLIDLDVIAARQHARDCTVVKFPGVGHLMHWQRPGEIANHALTFLEAVS